MKTFFYPLFLLFFIFSGYSQDIKIKKDVVYVDDVAWLKSEGCGTFSIKCSLFNNDGDEIIYTSIYKSKETDSKGHSKYSFFIVKFLETNQRFEIEQISGWKALIKILYKAKVVNDDITLNEENIQKLVNKYGNDLTDKYEKTDVIIIKEEKQTERARNNFNLRIGN